MKQIEIKQEPVSIEYSINSNLFLNEQEIVKFINKLQKYFEQKYEIIITTYTSAIIHGMVVCNFTGIRFI